MSEVCTHCGADYAPGVNAACRYCRLAPDMLFRFSLPEPGSDDGPEEVAFDVSEWDPSDRVQLGLILTERNVPWRWDPGPLLVAQRFDEAVVEELLDELGYDDEDDEGEGDDGEGSWEDFEGEEADEEAVGAMGDLFVAADRLVRNPVDGDQIAEVGRLREIVTASAAPFGIEPQVWNRLGALAAAVTDAAGEGDDGDDDDGDGDEDLEADDDDEGEAGVSEVDVEAEISDAARVLRDFLRPYV